MTERYMTVKGAWMCLYRTRDGRDTPTTLEDAEGGEIGLPDGRVLKLTVIGTNQRVWSLKHEGSVSFYDARFEISENPLEAPWLILTKVPPSSE